MIAIMGLDEVGEGEEPGGAAAFLVFHQGLSVCLERVASHKIEWREPFF